MKDIEYYWHQILVYVDRYPLIFAGITIIVAGLLLIRLVLFITNKDKK